MHNDSIGLLPRDDPPVEVRCAGTDFAVRERCGAHAEVVIFEAKILKPLYKSIEYIDHR